jgi:hypothetical protein
MAGDVRVVDVSSIAGRNWPLVLEEWSQKTLEGHKTGMGCFPS